MSSLNRVTLIGRTGKDIELRYMQSGDAVGNVSLATSESWKDKNSGEKKEATEWHNLVFYKRQAEIMEQYAPKGSLIYVEGKLKTRKWTDKEGNDKYTTEIHVTEMKLLGEKKAGGDQSPGYPREEQGGSERRPQQQRGAQRPAPSQDSGGYGDMDDDIPFMQLDWRTV